MKKTSIAALAGIALALSASAFAEHTEIHYGQPDRFPAANSSSGGAGGASSDARAQVAQQRSKGSALFDQLHADSGLGPEYRSSTPRR